MALTQAHVIVKSVSKGGDAKIDGLRQLKKQAPDFFKSLEILGFVNRLKQLV